MLRIAAAAVLAAHGLIHLIGFVVPWGIAALDEFPYRTSALGGAVELGETGARLVGLAWLAIAAAFVVAALGAWRRAGWTIPLAAGLAVASSGVCLLGLPEAGTGIPVNVAILVAVIWVAAARPRRLGAAR